MPPVCVSVLVTSISVAIAAAAHAQEKQSVIVSTFAPAKDTEAQLQDFLERIEKDLEDKALYGESEQKRVALNASTVAVLALTLGMHDKDTRFKSSASKLIELASELAENAETFDEATNLNARLAAVVKSLPKGEKVSWDEPVADLAMLMQQVPIVNDQLRRGVTDKRRFARNVAGTAGKAVTLAAIAQASMVDTTYCGDEADEKEWQKICAEMRDACADVYKALLNKDQEKAKEGNARIVKTCDACHDKFR
jgi:hypothetical protein